MEARAPIIWVVNDGGHSYEKARDLVGDLEIRYLTKGRQPVLRVDRVSYELAEGIGRHVMADDYLIIGGAAMVNALAVSLWLLRFWKVNVLQWNASNNRRCYELSTLEDENLRNLLDRVMLHG